MKMDRICWWHEDPKKTRKFAQGMKLIDLMNSRRALMFRFSRSSMEERKYVKGNLSRGRLRCWAFMGKCMFVGMDLFAYIQSDESSSGLC